MLRRKAGLKAPPSRPTNISPRPTRARFPGSHAVVSHFASGHPSVSVTHFVSVRTVPKPRPLSEYNLQRIDLHIRPPPSRIISIDK